MAEHTIPLLVSDELLEQVKRAASETGISPADVMRQSMIYGLPEFKKTAAPLKPMTREEMEQIYGPNSSNPEFDALEGHCASLPSPPPPDFE